MSPFSGTRSVGAFAWDGTRWWSTARWVSAGIPKDCWSAIRGCGSSGWTGTPARSTIARERLAKFGDRFEAVEASYAELPSILSQRGRGTVDGLLLDLGLSSRQLLDTDRGFSFLRPGPLDMRMSRSLTRTAWQILAHSSESELADIFRTYGEEPQSRRIAEALKEALRQHALPNDAWQVAETIRRAVASPGKRIDPATRCFQALRIVVNHELENLDKILAEIKDLLVPAGGRRSFRFIRWRTGGSRRRFSRRPKAAPALRGFPNASAARLPGRGWSIGKSSSRRKRKCRRTPAPAAPSLESWSTCGERSRTMRGRMESELLRKRLKMFGVILCILMVRVWETVQGAAP